jgi:hypothetical protein
VAARVATLLPARERSEPADVATIEVAAQAMRVTLTRPDGAPLGERVIDARFPCADLAQAAAVVVATWESDVHPEFRAAAPAPAVTTAAAPPPAPASAATYDLGAAIAGSLAPSSAGAAPALAALLVGTWAPAPRGLGGRVAFTWPAERDLALGDARVLWRRASLSLGPQIRWVAPASRWALDLHAEAIGAWLTASGEGFVRDRQVNSFDPGVGAGARVLWLGAGRLVPWLEVSATGWPREQTAYATPDIAAGTALPRFEAGLALGLSFGAKK